MGFGGRMWILQHGNYAAYGFCSMEIRRHVDFVAALGFSDMPIGGHAALKRDRSYSPELKSTGRFWSS